MAPFIRVVAGEVDSIGPLPAVARRLDTGHRVDPRTRMQACGYYDVETVTVDQLPPGLTAEQQATIMIEAATACDRHNDKTVFVDDMRATLEEARDYNWSWLQTYSAVQFDGLEPGAGAGWTSTPPASRLEVLRSALSYVMWQQIGLSNFADVAGRLLRPVLDVTDYTRPAQPHPPMPTLLPVIPEES